MVRFVSRVPRSLRSLGYLVCPGSLSDCDLSASRSLRCSPARSLFGSSHHANSQVSGFAARRLAVTPFSEPSARHLTSRATQPRISARNRASYVTLYAKHKDVPLNAVTLLAISQAPSVMLFSHTRCCSTLIYASRHKAMLYYVTQA